jgi:hypothetical protein
MLVPVSSVRIQHRTDTTRERGFCFCVQLKRGLTKKAPGNMCTASRIAREALWVHLAMVERGGGGCNNCGADALCSGERASQRSGFCLPRTTSEMRRGRGERGRR